MAQAGTDDDEWTEATEADVPRADLVGAAANGVPGFLVMKQGAAGLLDADYVRGLIAKAEPETPGPQETVTMTGSPAAIAAMIHGAALAKAAPAASPAEAAADIAKAQESAAAQNDLPDSAFAYIESGGTKDEDGKTVPRSLRHFNIHDAAHVRDALSRAPQSPFGDEAMPKIRAAAKKFGIDVAKQADETPESTEVTKDMDEDETGDGMDPTVILAEPDEDMPGSPSEPGSPAWEAIDAATACKWTALLARARAALDLMADREMLEAASADPADAENAMDLQDASCAIDYVIATLAPFAVNEQSEADQGAMEMIGKAMGEFNQAPIALLEALAPLAKSGRVLSTQNENAIRTAVASLQKVLASLPPAPDAPDGGQQVAKTANEEPDMSEPTTSSDATEASGQVPAMGAAEAPPQPVAGVPVTDMAKGAAPVAKADKPPQVAVYDASGNLVGVADPADITMIADAKAPAPAEKADGDETAPAGAAPAAAPAPEAPPADLAPAPPASAGTPADGTPAPDDDTVAKSAEPDATHDLLKSIAENLLKAAMDDYSAKQADVVKSLEERNKALEERLANVENQPAVMAIASNGAIPQPHQMRGQDYGATAVDLTKAQQLRTAYKGSDDVRQQSALATDLNALAIEKLAEIHAAGPR